MEDYRMPDAHLETLTKEELVPIFRYQEGLSRRRLEEINYWKNLVGGLYDELKELQFQKQVWEDIVKSNGDGSLEISMENKK